MKSLFAGMIFLLAMIPNHAKALSDDVVVKVHSGLCNSNFVNFAGSGMLFKNNGRIYALTSEHVVLHANGEFCHSVSNNTIGSKAADLAAVDWGMGLALLVLDEKSLNVDLPVAAFFSVEAPLSNEGVVTYGYPYESDNLLSDANGRVMDLKSKRAYVPLVGDMIEILGSHGEFGMSGGPVVSGKDGKFIGVLSHQFIEMVPGGKSSVGEFSSGLADVKNHLLVIPSAAVRSWLSGYFKNPVQYKPAFVMDPRHQIDRRQVVFSSGLKFEFMPTGAKTGTDGGGIGGGDGVGIGGGDGVGIGGDDTPTVQFPGSGAGYVSISFDREKHAAAWTPSEVRSVWLEGVRDKLLKLYRVQVPFFIDVTPDDSSMRKVMFQSLADFMNKLVNSGFEAATVIEAGSDAERDASSEVPGRLKNAGGVMFKISSSLIAQVQGEDSAGSRDARMLLGELKLAGELLAAGDWNAVSIAFLNKLDDKNREAAWQFLFTRYFNDSVELLKSLTAAREDLKKIRM